MIKKYLSLCADYCKRFTSSWDYYCLASDAYCAGYRAAREAANIPQLGEEFVEFTEDLSDGKHQLSERTFRKTKQENYSLPLNELLRIYIPMIEFTDVRVEEKDGVISFQGMSKRVKP